MVTSQSELTTRRVPVVTAVTCEAGAGNPSRILSMIDLSEGGFFIQTAFPLSIGTRMQCHFHLGDQPEPLHVHAEVAWVRPGPEDMMPPPGMGLRFLRMQVAVLERIRNVISRHNAQIQYFQQHQHLSEDAMLLSVPRVSLVADDQGPVDCRLASWNGRNLVVTMALPFEPGQAVKAQGGQGLLSEQGRISWIQFVAKGHDGPEIAMGLELQMNTWGQELALRRPSTELVASDGDSEWDYEILQSIPASLTLAPTLPISEQTARKTIELTQPVGAPTGASDAKVPVAAVSAPPGDGPVLLLKKSAPTADAVAADRPQPVTTTDPPQPAADASLPAAAWAPRFPAPQIATDTYPVSLGVSSGGWPLNAKASLVVFGILVAGVGLFGVLGSKSAGPQRDPSITMQEWNLFLGKPQSSWPVCHGTAVRMQLPKTQAAAVTVAPVDASQSKVMQPDPASSADAPKPSAPGEGKTVPVQFSTKGGVSRLTLELDTAPHHRNFYTLADPAGVVIDLEGSRILQKSGFLGGDGKRIRKLKVVPMTTKSRLIVYTQTLPGRIQVDSQGNRLIISLHFEDTLAHR